MSISAQPRVDLSPARLSELAAEIKRHGVELGFQQLGITGIDLGEDERMEVVIGGPNPVIWRPR